MAPLAGVRSVPLPILTSSTQCMDPFARAAVCAAASSRAAVLSVTGVVFEVLEPHAAEIAATKASTIAPSTRTKLDRT